MTRTRSRSECRRRRWTEKDELCLLSAVLEIAREPADSYDPRVNLFDRIGKSLMKPYANKEVLRKVKELKARYAIRCRQIRPGSAVAKRTAAFKISEDIWGAELKDEEEAAKGNRTSEDSEKFRGQKVEHLKATKPKPTACAPETNPHEASRPNLKRAHEPTEKRDGAGPKKKKKRRGRNRRGNPHNKKPEDKEMCFNCGKPGHFPHNCPEKKKFEKNSVKQKETEELQPEAENKHTETEGLQPEAENKQKETKELQPEAENKQKETEELQSEAENKQKETEELQPEAENKQKETEELQPEAENKQKETEELQSEAENKQKETEELQPEAENMREEQSCTPISASFQPGSHQIKPQQAQQREEGHNSPQPIVRGNSPQKTQQREESHNIPPQPGAHRFTQQKTQQRAQPGAHQIPSDRNGVNVSNSFRPGAHRPTFEQPNVVNRFQHGSSPQHWNRGSPLPPILSPASWVPRPPITVPFPPPPQVPYRFRPPHRMNYTLPRNYNYPPSANFNQSPAAPNYPMFNPRFPRPIINFSRSPPPPNYPMFNDANLR